MGSTAIVSSASICSVTRIVPSSVATALPTRATSTMQVNTGARSLSRNWSTSKEDGPELNDRRGFGYYVGSASGGDARDPRSNRAEQFVGNGIAKVRQILGGDAFPALRAEEHDLVAEPRVGHVGHIDHHHVHADGADLFHAAAAQQHFRL